MNKWSWLILAVLCWLIFGFTIFYPRQDRDSKGISLPERTDRIVSLAPNLTEILFAIGLEDEIVGVTLDSDYPPEAEKKPKVGTFWQPNIEAVVAARPSLVITLEFEQQKNLADRLKRIGYKNLAVKIEKVGDLYKVIGKIGEETNRRRRANELINRIKTKLQQLSILVGNRPKVGVLWVVQREPLRVAGRDTFVNEMIEMAGGENAIGQTVYKYPPIGAEQVMACNAEVIIESAMGPDDIEGQRARALQYWSKYQYLPAVATGRVYVIDGDTVSRLGPRLYEGTETIAGCLRPDLFKDIKK